MHPCKCHLPLFELNLTTAIHLLQLFTRFVTRTHIARNRERERGRDREWELGVQPTSPRSSVVCTVKGIIYKLIIPGPIPGPVQCE